MISTMEDYNQEISSSNSNATSFEFHKGSNNGGGGNRSSSNRRTALGKPTPSKWDDAQKWLVGLSRGGINGGGDKNHGSKPRNSNADDLRLIAPVPHKEEPDYSSGEENEVCEDLNGLTNQYDAETKTVDCEESVWRINKISQHSASSGGVRSVCVRDMGTEMTPIASQEPSRTATPIRASTPVARSPISSGPPTPSRCQHGSQQAAESYQNADSTQSFGSNGVLEGITAERGGNAVRRREEESNSLKAAEKDSERAGKLNSLETRATAWDEAERTKYMARYKGEEVKIQAWENHEKRKAEMEMKKMEVKAERMKARAQEKYANKLASTKRIAEEKRANAEAKLNEKAIKTSEKADYIRRTGHLPTSFSFKLPSLCW